MSENLILYTSNDGRSTVSLFERDGSVWLEQSQMAKLFATSKQNVSLHIKNILKDKELDADSVVKDYLTTDADGKKYSVKFYSLEMIMAGWFSGALCAWRTIPPMGKPQSYRVSSQRICHR